MRTTLLALLLAIALPGASGAVPVAVPLSGTWSLSGDALSGAGLSVRASATTGSFDLALADGAESRFRLFRLWTDEADVGADDRIARSIFADFALPGARARAAGAVRGNQRLGLQWGSVAWEKPVELPVAGGMLSILLSDQSFGRGILGLGQGRRNGADIFAQVSYTAGVTTSPVPLPAGLPLLLSALGVLGLAGLRRRAPA